MSSYNEQVVNHPIYISPDSFKETTVQIIAILYTIFGLFATSVLVFVILTVIKKAPHKKGIYSIFKTTMWYEIMIALHTAKGGVTIIIGESNSLACKVDTGITFYAMNLLFYYSVIMMVFLFKSKGEFPKISSLKRTLLNIPAILVALVIVIVIMNYDLSGISAWQTCFLDKESNIPILVFFIPLFTYAFLCIIFFILVVKGNIHLKGILKNLHFFNLINSLCFVLMVMNYLVDSTYWMGAAALILILINIIYFRLNNDIIIQAFNNNKISSNKVFFFIATLFCIDSPPTESKNLDIAADQKMIIEEYEKRRLSKYKVSPVTKHSNPFEP